MKDFTIYEIATGRILATGHAPEAEEILPRDEHELVIACAANPETQYVSNGALTNRPAMMAKLVGKSILDMPIPATVVINGTGYDVSDGSAHLEFAYRGTYAVQVIAFPYLDAEFTVPA